MTEKLSEEMRGAKECGADQFADKVESLEQELSDLRITKLHNSQHIERLIQERDTLKEQNKTRLDIEAQVIAQKAEIHSLKEQLAKCERLRDENYGDAQTFLKRAESAESEVKHLGEMLGSLTGDEKLTIIHWKRLFDSYIELRDKNKDTEARLAKVQELVKLLIKDYHAVTNKNLIEVLNALGESSSPATCKETVK